MRRYGLKPDDPDERDHKFSASWFSRAKYMPESWLPKARSLFDCFPAVLDQGPFGSCTGHGATEAMRFNLINNGYPDCELSRLFPYYMARKAEGTINEDSGAQIRNVVKALAKYGAPRESYWAYDGDNLFKEPSDKAFTDAIKHMVIDYQSVEVSTRAVKTALYVGRPVIIGVTLFRSFESDRVAHDGYVPMPSPGETEVGGHCMLVGGYKPGFFIVRNSWGPNWGDQGNAYLPEEYLIKYGRDFWVLNSDNDY